MIANSDTMTETDIIVFYDGLLNSITNNITRRHAWLDYEDVKQATRIGCFLAIRTFEGELKGDHWIRYLVLRCWGQAIDYIRELQPFPRSSKGMTEVDIYDVPDQGDEYKEVEGIGFSIDFENIFKYCDRLPENEAAVLYSTYVQPIPVHKIAEKLGVTPSRITQLHRQAIEKLRNQLEV